jgi:hypothetical protein
MTTIPSDCSRRQSCPRGAFILLALSLSIRAGAETLPDDSAVPSTISLAGVLTPTVIDATAPVIDSITILNGSIFDPQIPEENKAFYKLANKIHITTRPAVIEQQLLFTEGEKLTLGDLKESERILRSNRYIQDASIETLRNADGTVDVNVRTSDVWTLIPRVSFSRTGGENNSGIGVKEMNLLGTGMEIEALYKSSIDRDSLTFKFFDEHLGSSWYSLTAIAGRNSDGHTGLLDFRKPFYSLDSHTAHGVSYLNNDQIDSLYEGGEITNQFRDEAESFEIFQGWSSGLDNGWTKRYLTGFSYDSHQFSPLDNGTGLSAAVPENRKFVYPFVGIEILEDRYEEARNVEQVNRTEDHYLGTRFAAQLGYASTALGSDRDAWMINAGAQTGFGSVKSSSLMLASNLAARMEDSGVQNLTLGVSARYYRRQSEKRLFYASLSGIYGNNLDLDNQLLLGGDNGLRGYPLRYRSGDRSALLTIEQRFFTDWYPFRLFRVGAAVFFDAGKTWQSQNAAGPNQGLLRDVGFGLRLGNSRSGQGRMAHIDLAFPLDGDQSIKNVQLIIETKKSF